MYYVELYGGLCCLATNKVQAMREHGTNNVKRITTATKEQIEWVRAMGGYVPEKGKK